MEVSIEPNFTNGEIQTSNTTMTNSTPNPPLATPTTTTKCQICKDLTAKYRCPRCDARTCSLACVKQHKIEKSCNGVKNPSEFVKLSKFDTTNLLRGFFLLIIQLILYCIKQE